MKTISTTTIEIRTLVILFLSIGCLRSASAFNAIKTRTTSFGSCVADRRSHYYHLSGIVVSSSSEGVQNEVESSALDLEATSVEEEIDWDWKEVTQSIFEGEDKRPIILFDGVCNLCNGGVNFALDNDEVGHFRFASLQSKIGKSFLIRSGKETSDLSSIVLIDNDNAYFKADAVIRIAHKLNYPLNVLSFAGRMVPGFFKNIAYEYVSKNRYRFGVIEDSCRLFDDNFDSRFIRDP